MTSICLISSISKIDVVVDRLALDLGDPPELGVQVQVDALVVLELTLGQDLAAGEVVERCQDVPQPQDRAEQQDERLLCGLAENRCAERVQQRQLRDLRLIVGVVVGVRLEYHDAARVLVAKQGQRLVGGILQVPERDDVAVGLDRVEDPVGARKRLYQTVLAQALVDPERVQCRGVEAREEHVDDDDQVEVTVLQSLGQVLVVVLEPLGRGVEARAEQVVVVLDRVLEELARALVEVVGLELLLGESPSGSSSFAA